MRRATRLQKPRSSSSSSASMSVQALRGPPAPSAAERHAPLVDARPGDRAERHAAVVVEAQRDEQAAEGPARLHERVRAPSSTSARNAATTSASVRSSAGRSSNVSARVSVRPSASTISGEAMSSPRTGTIAAACVRPAKISSSSCA